MVTTTVNPQTDFPYSAALHRAVAQTTAYILQIVQTAGPILPGEVREQALHTLSYALGLPEAWPMARDLLVTMAPKMEQAGFRYEWLPYLEHGLHQSQQYQDFATQAELQYQIGLLYRLQSKFASACHWLTASAELYAVLSNPNGQARSLNQLAYMAYLEHRYEDAQTMVDQALSLATKDTLIQAMSYFVKGVIAIDHNRWQEAEMWHREALKVRQTLGDQRRTGWSLLDLANVLRGQRKFAEAIDYYQQAATILNSLGDIHFWSHAQMNLGLTHFYNGQAEAALACYLLAKAEWQKYNDTLNLAKLSTNLGLAYLKLKHLSEAEQAFQTSVHLYQQMGDESARLNAVDGLALTLIAQQQYEKAVAVLEQGLAALPKIITMPNYQYLFQAMTKHLHEARGLVNNQSTQ